MKSFKNFYNKKNILRKLRKEFSNIEFDIVPYYNSYYFDKIRYILVYQVISNNKTINIIDLNEIEKNIKVKLNDILIEEKDLANKRKNISPINNIQLIHRDFYDIQANKIIMRKFSHMNKQKNNTSFCAEEIIQLIKNIENKYINEIYFSKIYLKGSTAKFLFYNMGDIMPNNINWTIEKEESISKYIDIIIEYCEFNNLKYKYNYNSFLKKGYIKIENILTFTFDNNLKHLDNSIYNKEWDMNTYPLEILDELKTVKKENKN